MRVQRAGRSAVVWRRVILLSGTYGVLCGGVAAAGETAYVVNVGSDDVSVIDTATRSVVATVKVGPQPNGIAVDPDGSHAYVTNFRADTVSVIDGASNTVDGEIAVGHEPVGIAVSPDGAFAYVANRGASSVSIIDLRAGAVSATIADGIGPGSNGIAIAPDGASAYVNNAFSKDPGTVSVIDTASGSVVGTVAVYRNPKRVAIAPDGGTAYVANFRSWNISVVDTASRAFLTGLRVSGRTVGAAVHPNGAYAYVTNLSGYLEVLQTGDNTLTEPIAVGRQPYAVALTHRGGEAYVVNADDDTVSVVDLDRDAVVADVAVGDKPFAVAIGCTGAGCTDPPFTPKPTRTATISPTISATPTITPTPLSTPTPTPNPNAVILQVGTASGSAGDRVEVSVVLDAKGASVAGIQIDVGFAPPVTIAGASDGRPACTIGSTLRDTLVLSSAFQPPSCTGSGCHAIRAILLSFSDVEPLPDHAVMFSCDVLIAPDAAPGSYPLSASNAGASSPEGDALDTNGASGTVTVRARSAAAARILASRTSLCSGGPRDGAPCDDDGLLCDCPGGHCDGQSTCGDGSSPGTCRGGSADGRCCDPDFTCAGGNACTPTQRSCLGGVAKGLPCLHDTQCPGSACRSTSSFCAGGTFDRYACVDERDCPLGACVAPPTPSLDATRTPLTTEQNTPEPMSTERPTRTGGPTGSAGDGSTSGGGSGSGGGSCAIGSAPTLGPGPVWLLALPAALLAARSRRRPARPPAAPDVRAE